MQMSVSQNAATTSYSSYVGMMSLSFTYNPALSGSITQLQVSVDLEGLSVSGSSYVQFFAEQNGAFYEFNTPSMTPSGLTDWKTYSGTLSASTIASAFGLKSDGTTASGLNLGATAPPIEFGIGVGEVSATTIQNSFGIDNLSISVVSVPEPPTWILLALAGTAFVVFSTRERARQ